MKSPTEARHVWTGTNPWRAPKDLAVGTVPLLEAEQMYNFGVSNDRSLVTEALTIGVGMAFLLASYL